jgi:hypothetical protein
LNYRWFEPILKDEVVKMIFKFTRQNAARLVVIAACFGLVSACHGPGDDSGVVSIGTINGEQCFQQTFTQPNSAPNKLDVLLVANTRAEENNLRQSLASSWDSYSAQLPWGSDFRVAVMLGNGSESEWSGRLWHHWDDPSVLHREDSLFGWIVTDFLAFDFWDFPYDQGGLDGQEELFSLSSGVTNAGDIWHSQNEGFFRPDAALAVVFISDVPDACFQADLDPTASSSVDCKGFSVKNLYASLQAFKGAEPVVLEGVVHTDSRGAGYTDLIQLGKGLAIDPNDNSCFGTDDIMRKLGRFAADNAFVFNTTFPISMDPLDDNAFKVWLNGQLTTSYTYNPAGNTISVPEANGPGSTVVVKYCLEGTYPSPTPTPSFTASPCPLPSKKPRPSPSPEPSVRPAPSASPAPSATPPPRPSTTPSATPTPTPSATPTVAPKPSPSTTTVSPSPSPSACTGPLCGSGPVGV